MEQPNKPTLPNAVRNGDKKARIDNSASPYFWKKTLPKDTPTGKPRSGSLQHAFLVFQCLPVITENPYENQHRPSTR